MCGRYTLAVEMDELAERFGCPRVELVFKARYNVSPANIMPVVVSPSGGNRELRLMQWGLVPFWANDCKSGYKMINARIETVAQKPAFREAYRHRRCLVPATGYYEWLQHGKQKQPYYIHMPDHKIFAFAGLWEEWGESGQKLQTFTILTTEPSTSILHLHNRMPFILPYDQESAWLQGQSPPKPESQLAGYEVNPLVNRAVNDLPNCIKPLR